MDLDAYHDAFMRGLPERECIRAGEDAWMDAQCEKDHWAQAEKDYWAKAERDHQAELEREHKEYLRENNEEPK